MSFSDDPMMGMTSDRFTGSATATLATQSFRDAHRVTALSALNFHNLEIILRMSAERNPP